MADIEYFDDEVAEEPAPAEPSRVGAMVNWAGAMVSLGLVAGMAVWAWQLTVRDVSGVPVVRALEGPMRIAPDNPGGLQAEHQGLAVNRIAEGQEAAPGPERIVLAPPPVALEEIDLSSASIPEVTDAAEVPTPEAAAEATLALIDRLMQGAEPEVGAPEADQAASDAAAVPAEAAETAEPAGPVALAGAAPAAIEVIDVSVPGVRQSPRPVGRPANLQLASLSTDAAGASAPATGVIAADALAQGTRLVQLGAFDDAATAEAEWARLTRAFPDFFAGKARVVQQAVSGGREFFRLRAHGFDDLSDARRFCTALLAEGAACIPVTVR